MRRLACALVVASATTSHAQTFDLLSSQTLTVPNLHEEWNSFELVVQLRIPNTPDAIKTAEIFDALGRQVQFRMLADKDTGLIIGTIREGIEIELIRRFEGNNGGLLGEDPVNFILLGRKEGVPVVLSGDDILITDLNFGKYCLTLEPLKTSDIPMTVNVAVDVSGSMEEAMSDVRQSFLNFMERLPDGAMCRVSLFNHEARYLNPLDGAVPLSGTLPKTYSCDSFASVDVENIMIAEGGTDIVNALSPLYAYSLEEMETQTLIAVISDGIGAASRGSDEFQYLVSARDQAVEYVGVYTMVNWLGSYETNYPLSDLADSSFIGRIENQPVAQDFFQHTKKFLQSQSVLTPVNCEGQKS